MVYFLERVSKRRTLFVAVCCSVLQCVAVRCSLLQRLNGVIFGASVTAKDAVCCIVLQCVAVRVAAFEWCTFWGECHIGGHCEIHCVEVCCCV